MTTTVEVDKAEAFRRFMSTMRHEGFDDALRYYTRSTRLTEAFPEVTGPIDSYLTARRNLIEKLEEIARTVGDEDDETVLSFYKG